MRGSLVSDDRGVAFVLRPTAPASDRWRVRARYVLLGTALLTSPIVLPFALTLLMVALHGTSLGAAVLERLHLIYIGSVVCCLTALAMACVAFQAAPDEGGRRARPARRPHGPPTS